jgi:pimeloyl-ACP methyl ester carboxylesterase
MNHFSELDYPCYAVSLRGTSMTGMPPNDPGETVVIDEHLRDVEYVIDTVRQSHPNGPKPVIIGHSFGGIVAMKLLENPRVRNKVSGLALLCSVPPSGNGPMTGPLPYNVCTFAPRQ